jgi:NAD(P)-dependent dehydrogenase (short-subunit alcohol dehydrogenase family)
MTSLPEGYRAAVWGASGGIGRAFLSELASDPRCGEVLAISRAVIDEKEKVTARAYDPSNEASIADAAQQSAQGGKLDLVLVATGTLHDEGYGPEKALRQVEADAFLEVMRINALLPALIAKASLSHMAKGRSILAALSARVGSIGDNRLGGWYSYRASKAALNMLLRNVAIETARKNKDAVVCGLHPGTVDTGLSEPFQGNVPEGKLFTPTYSAQQLLGVLDRLSPEHSGRVFDYAGEAIEF